MEKKIVFRIAGKIVTKKQFVAHINSGWVIGAELSPYFRKRKSA
jgi:hypothetical protein